MSVFFISLLIIFLFFIFKILNKASSIQEEPPKIETEFDYQAIKCLLTKAERSFYGVLLESLKDEKYDIFSKVRVADVIKPASGITKSQWHKSFNKIAKKHFDFVICDRAHVNVLCVIELDDSSHNSKKRKIRDDFLVSACKSASVPFIQVDCKHTYNVENIRDLVKRGINTESPEFSELKACLNDRL